MTNKPREGREGAEKDKTGHPMGERVRYKQVYNEKFATVVTFGDQSFAVIDC